MLLLDDATAHSTVMEMLGLFMRNHVTVEVGVMLCKVQTRYLLVAVQKVAAQMLTNKRH